MPVARRFCRESYSEPEEVYFRLKQTGIDLVTVHDSIGAALTLSRYPDFFASEEVTVTLPSGNEAHMAVYGLNERQHLGIQRRRRDLPSLLAYLREQRLPFGVNHMFSGLTGRRVLEDFAWFEQAFPMMETLNGSMPRRANREAAVFARIWRKSAYGRERLAHAPKCRKRLDRSARGGERGGVPGRSSRRVWTCQGSERQLRQTHSGRGLHYFAAVSESPWAAPLWLFPW